MLYDIGISQSHMPLNIIITTSVECYFVNMQTIMFSVTDIRTEA